MISSLASSSSLTSARQGRLIGGARQPLPRPSMAASATSRHSRRMARMASSLAGMM